MDKDQEKAAAKNPVIKALVARYKKLVALPVKEKKTRRRYYAGTNSRIGRSDIASSTGADNN